MLHALNVSSEDSAAAVQLIEENLAWQTSEAANDIKRRFSKTPTTIAVPTTTEPNNITDSTTDEKHPENTTQSANNLIFSGSLLLFWSSTLLL